MKAVIVAGGQGKRLGKLGEKIPKALIEISGKPVLEYQINLLVDNGFKEVWLLIGHKGEMVRNYFGNGEKWNIKIHYSQEDFILGTAGSIKSIENKLKKDFLVLYGDVMVNFDIKRFINFHSRYGKESLATIVVHPNDHPLESDLVEVSNNQLTNIYPKPHLAKVWRHNLVSAAIYILSPKIFKYIKAGEESDFGKNIFPYLLQKKRKISAYNTWEYFRDIGRIDRLRIVRKECKTGIYESLNYKQKQKAIFLDRDGVINEEVDELDNIDNLSIYSSSFNAIRRINQSGFHAIVITNQPMIAKGSLTEQGLDEIHRKLETLLGEQGAKVDAFYYCPHHPERGWKGEVKKLKINCNCRKPKIGLIKKASKDFNIDLKKSYFIGDSFRDDYQLAINAGIKFIGVKTGYGLKNMPSYGKLNISKILIKKNLDDAVKYILKLEK